MSRNFPFFSKAFRNLTGRRARRVYLVIILLLVCLTTAFRVRSYLMSRRIQAVLHGLAELRIDRTAEEEMLKTVPYLIRSDYRPKLQKSVQHWYYARVTNESDFLIRRFIAYGPSWSGKLAYWLGYRYMNFGASVIVEDGKVTRVEYGLAKIWAYPVEASYIVSARSVHAFWIAPRHGLSISSEQDESPKYRVIQDAIPDESRIDHTLSVTFTNDAPPELTKRAFMLHLSCFWSLRGCEDARQIASEVWQDAQAIQQATLQQLRSEKCPDSIIEGRMRYLPDVSVFLLEVTGSRRIMINEEGDLTEDWFTDYKLKEEIRGHSAESWKNIRFQRKIPSPINPTETIANQIYPSIEIGSQVLFFGNIRFDSCRFIPASPSALNIVRNVPVPPKRPEDQIFTSLM